jgi:hypothetical protein
LHIDVNLLEMHSKVIVHAVVFEDPPIENIAISDGVNVLMR